MVEYSFALPLASLLFDYIKGRNILICFGLSWSKCQVLYTLTAKDECGDTSESRALVETVNALIRC